MQEYFDAREEHGKKYGFKPHIQIRGNGVWYDINEIKIFL